ncbi:hypothetical protein AMYX_41420 [Anaeromyxobacter diazotrophicus]|uniref:Uncharacterized protein n=2 Tax=Anaeromyxobacter diazotrophicus TaxID=2590199 RepID=A0A7I9VSX3_9BACT|nr:hypothetical protein AMYX_41420 [Anaeromyxobacter diazotrophicus]
MKVALGLSLAACAGKQEQVSVPPDAGPLAGSDAGASDGGADPDGGGGAVAAAGSGAGDGGADAGAPDAGTGTPDAGTPDAGVTLAPPVTLDGWTFYGAQQGLPAETYDVSADEGGNVYVAGGDAVYAKAPAAALAPAKDTFARFDAAAAGLTQNCFQGLDPFTATEADLDRTAHPQPPGAPALCRIVSVGGAAAGKAIAGFWAYGTDGDLNAEWAKDSGGLDVLAFDAAAGKLTRTRHVYVATAPGVICGAFEQTSTPSATPTCQPWDEFMLYGRRKLHRVYRIAVNHHPGTPQYGDVWMGGTHVTLSAFFNDQAEARGWYGNGYIRSCPSAHGADPAVCPKFADPVTGAWNVFEHEHPAFNGTTYPDGVVKGPAQTGETWAIALAPSGQPWAHNGLRLGGMRGDTSNLGIGVAMDWNLVFDLWPDDPKADPTVLTQPADDDVQAMAFCPDGALWVGSRTHGLARVSTSDGSLAAYGLPGGGQNVWALACDRRDQLWISTDWGEIVRYDTHAGAWSLPLAAKAGVPELAHHVAWSIQVDDWSQPNPVVYFAMRSLHGAPGGVVAYAGP